MNSISDCLYGAGYSFLFIGIVFLVFIIFFDKRIKQDWYYHVTRKEALLRKLKNSCISFAIFIATCFCGIFYYVGGMGPYPKQAHLMATGMILSYLAIFIRSLKILFEKYQIE